MFKHFPLTIGLAVILSSCAGSLPYTTDYPLTNQVFHSRDGVFLGKIPQGWFSSIDDTLAPGLAAWLIRNDFFATLVVKELKLDRITIQQVEKEGLTLLARLSMGFREEIANGRDDIQCKEFEIRGKKFCSFEFAEGGKRTRVVVFAIKGKFYECEAMAVKGQWTVADLAKLFTTQQTFLSSVSF
jgi:hypothetical protein